MLVWATYTVTKVIEVPDNANDDDITNACWDEAPFGCDEVSWENY